MNAIVIWELIQAVSVFVIIASVIKFVMLNETEEKDDRYPNVIDATDEGHRK